MQMCFHLQSKWALSPHGTTKAVIHTDSFVRDGGDWEMPAGGKGLKAEGRPAPFTLLPSHLSYSTDHSLLSLFLSKEDTSSEKPTL